MATTLVDTTRGIQQIFYSTLHSLKAAETTTGTFYLMHFMKIVEKISWRCLLLALPIPPLESFCHPQVGATTHSSVLISRRHPWKLTLQLLLFLPSFKIKLRSHSTMHRGIDIHGLVHRR